jgi:hypothetical protein|nr:MAG TPA: hypothetical protein [Caudoviricetes sp.]
MACIGKISSSLALPCGAPGVSDFGQPQSAFVLNASDIASYTVNDISGLATITRKASAVGYEITAINNAMVVTVGLKSQDIIPGAYDVSITFKSLSGHRNISSTEAPLGVVGALGRAELVFAVDHGDGFCRVYGLGAPLVCTEISGDSSASSYVTYTYGVEDWQVGTTIHGLSKVDYDALSTPAAAPGA